MGALFFFFFDFRVVCLVGNLYTHVCAVADLDRMFALVGSVVRRSLVPACCGVVCWFGRPGRPFQVSFSPTLPYQEM